MDTVVIRVLLRRASGALHLQDLAPYPVSGERHASTEGLQLSSGLSIQFRYLCSPKFGI